jgi:hypothetical protein
MQDRVKILTQTYVQNSELALFYTRMDAQTNRIKYLVEEVEALHKRIRISDELVIKLAAEIGARKLLPVKRVNGKYSKSVLEVKKRYEVWKSEHANGMNIKEIADKWQVDYATVQYAKNRNWISKNMEKLK